MKKISTFAALIFGLANFANAQLYNNGAVLTVNTGATLFLNDNFVNAAGSTLNNKGTIYAQFDWTNTGNVTHTATANVILSGTNNSTISSGGKAFQNLEMQKGNGVSIYLGDAMTVNGTLAFSPSFFNNFILMGNNSLTFGATANITGAQADHYLVTSGTGLVKKMACSTFTFPVGFNSSRFNPITIVENGAQDTKNVRCLEHANAAGASGLPLAQGVADASWQITEGTTGGSNANITFQWASVDELPQFNRSSCSPYRYASGWQSQAAASSAIGFDPYSLNLLNASAFGYFMVGTPGAIFAAANDRDLAGESDFQVFPNPAQDFLTLKISSQEAQQGLAVDWLDVAGRLVFSEKLDLEKGENQLPCSLARLPAGIFWVRVEGYSPKRFVKID